MLNPLELVSIKALQIDLILLAGVPVFLQHLQDADGDILAFLMVEPRRLNFRVDSDIFPR